jgi:phenylacetate-CoA ligase
MPYFDRLVETLPRAQLADLQYAKLQALLSELQHKNRFYSAKWDQAGIDPCAIRSLAELSRLPFTTKAELMQSQAAASPFGTNATYNEESYTRFHQTSGTSGVPLRVLDTQESWEWWGKCWGHIFAGAGLSAKDRIFLAFSFGPFIGFWAAVEGAKAMKAMMIPGGGWDSHQRLHMMRDLGASALCCTPSYALRLAEVAREQGFDLRTIPLRATIHAGEPGANIAHTKARIEAAWGCKCFDHAGGAEVGAHSFECELQPGGIHPIESEFIIEVIDPETTRSTPAGQTGELVITNLGRPGYPVIRYRTGDLVCLNPSPCRCGRTYQRFEGGLLGRCDDMVTIRGVNVYPAAIENMIHRFAAVAEYQVKVTRQREMQEMAVEIEVVPGSDSESIRAAVEEAIHHALSLRAKVGVAAPGTLPRYEMKARRFKRLDVTAHR